MYTYLDLLVQNTSVNTQFMISAYQIISSKSDESQKGINTILRCSVENQKGAFAIDFIHR